MLNNVMLNDSRLVEWCLYDRAEPPAENNNKNFNLYVYIFNDDDMDGKENKIV